MYVAPLQDDMLLGIDFLKKHGVQMHCGVGELRVGSSLTIQPLHKGETPLGGVVAVR
jgi:hypothetical protein